MRSAWRKRTLGRCWQSEAALSTAREWSAAVTSAGVAAEQSVASAAAAGVEDCEAVEGFRGDAGFCLECGVIFGFVCDVKAGPLKAEGFEVQIGDEAWYAVDDGGDDCAVGVDESGAIAALLQRALEPGCCSGGVGEAVLAGSWFGLRDSECVCWV